MPIHRDKLVCSQKMEQLGFSLRSVHTRYDNSYEHGTISRAIWDEQVPNLVVAVTLLQLLPSSRKHSLMRDTCVLSQCEVDNCRFFSPNLMTAPERQKHIQVQRKPVGQV